MAKIPTPSAHTYGPWTLHETDDMDEVWELRGDRISKPIVYIFKAFNSPEHDLTPEERAEDEAEYAANACLIAAAPDLLERARMSLADAEVALAHPEKVAGFNWQSIADDLRMIIAKAAGRSRRKT